MDKRKKRSIVPPASCGHARGRSVRRRQSRVPEKSAGWRYPNFRQISIDRIENARLLKEKFDPSGFGTKEFLSNTLYRFAGDNNPFTIKLVFDKAVADSVLEREWHPNQQATLQKSENVELEFTAKGDI